MGKIRVEVEKQGGGTVTIQVANTVRTLHNSQTAMGFWVEVPPAPIMDKDASDLEIIRVAFPDIPAPNHFELRKEYKMSNEEKAFIKSLPALAGDNKITYTSSQKKVLATICSRLASMNGHTEWAWMLKSATLTTDAKYPRHVAQHIYLNTVATLKELLPLQDAASEFQNSLNDSHIWYRKLLHNAYSRVL